MFEVPTLPFKTEDGTPTICFVLEEGAEILLPWHSFSSGTINREATRIELHFMDAEIDIEGSGLKQLWEQLRVQEVTLVTARQENASETESVCSVATIAVKVT